jgi:hypothetical protein
MPAQRAVSQARHVGILQGERTSYETVLGDLLAALGESSAQYSVTFPDLATDPARGAGVIGRRSLRCCAACPSSSPRPAAGLPPAQQELTRSVFGSRGEASQGTNVPGLRA